MNKVELVAAVAEKAELSKKDAEKAVSAVLDTVVETLASGDKVSVVGFGSFEIRERAERQGINPRTREPITIAASRSIVFKPGKSLKDTL